MSKRVQPAWTAPDTALQPALKLYNSLTRQKEVFVPQNGKKVTWYSCGPTVYDASHMGHARSYITFDILRRVLSGYFGYEIFYVMNITDIDDKIIKRARQNYLYEKYANEEHTLEDIINDSKCVMKKLLETGKNTSDPDKKDMYLNLITKLEKSLDFLENAIKNGDNKKTNNAKIEFIKESKDPLSEWLDEKYGQQITDNSIFKSLPHYWEEEFHKDMESLNIIKPNVLTRVSEYIPEIIEFIEKIIKNGFGYVANNSVYFDVATFDRSSSHYYAKLVPEAYGDTNSLQEGEGDLMTIEQHTEKMSPNDFALWKKSKPGEPAWQSPWGLGRPGWHIECSAMATAICGPNLDIHTGGVDLKFPHHDNEIAQTEAHYGNAEWVKYFLHSGHLTIAGCKMSKSLKNFVSIQDALSRYTARQLRFAFLLHPWRDTLDYSQNTMESALHYEKLFNEFFLNVKDLTRCLSSESTNYQTFQKWTGNEMGLSQKFLQTKTDVHQALCDNIDTKTAIDALRDLVQSSNLYIRDNKLINKLLLHDIGIYITKILSIFGTTWESPKIGFTTKSAVETDTECVVMPYLSILAEFRDVIRAHAKSLKAEAILNECDRLRDELLPNVGVRLEDRENGGSALKMVDRETLQKEKLLKKQLEMEKVLEKERRKAELLALQTAKDELKKIKPSDLFRMETDKYSKFDENGLPTHDANGKEISKGQMKKLQKLQMAQEKKYQEYLTTQS